LADAAGVDCPGGSDAPYQAYGPIVSSSGPDESSYTLDFHHPTALAGPIAVSLWATSTAPDTDFFVQLIDVDSKGQYQYLQRGLLRASFRAVDEFHSDRVPSGPHAGEVYRPYHPFTNAALLLPPGQPNQYQIEVFTLGHLFRAGHKLLVKVSAPPFADELYAYASDQPPA